MAESDNELRQITARLDRLSDEIDELRMRLREIQSGRTQPANHRSLVHTPFGASAVNYAGAITLVLGVIYFFKYAVDSRWIGPAGRLLLGLVGGIFFIGAADWLRRRNQQMLSQGIAGCGIATLYVTCYAAFSWYQYLPLPAAAIALFAVSTFAVSLSFYYGQQPVAALGFTGGVLTPILLRGSNEPSAMALAYLFVIDSMGLILVSRRRWSVLVPLIGAEAVIGAFVLTPSLHPERFTLFALGLAAVHFGAAASMPGEDSSHRAVYATGHGLVVLGMLRQLDLWIQHLLPEPARSGAESLSGSVFLAIYGITAIAYGVVRNSTFARTMGVVLIGIVISKLYLWDVWFLERLYRMSAFVALGILLLAASWIYSRARDSR